MKSYVLPKTLYYKSIAVIKDYPRMMLDYKFAIGHSVEQDGQPHGTKISDPTADDAQKLWQLSTQIEAVEKALGKIPKEYQKAILEKIVNRKPYPDYAALNTWKKWKQRMVYYTALYLGWIWE